VTHILRTPTNLHGLYSDNSELAVYVRVLSALVDPVRGTFVAVGALKEGG